MNGAWPSGSRREEVCTCGPDAGGWWASLRENELVLFWLMLFSPWYKKWAHQNWDNCNSINNKIFFKKEVGSWTGWSRKKEFWRFEGAGKTVQVGGQKRPIRGEQGSAAAGVFQFLPLHQHFPTGLTLPPRGRWIVCGLIWFSQLGGELLLASSG